MATKITSSVIATNTIANTNIAEGAVDTAALKARATLAGHLSSTAANSFSSITVDNSQTVVAESIGDTLSLLSGANITITGTSANDTIMITGIETSLANTNSYIASVQTTERAALANTNSYIASVQSTERAALANTNSYISGKADSAAPVFTGNISANGSVGVAGQHLTSGGTGTDAYWDTPAGGGGVSTGKAIAMAIVFG